MSEKIIFDVAFFDKKIDCSLVNKIYLTSNPEKLIFESANQKNNFKSCICILEDVPPYVNIEFNEKYDAFKLIRSNALDFYINLNGFSNIQEYLKAQMGSKSRSKLRGLINRLEKCFDITYNIYFGNITKVKYEFLFDYLKLFIEERFAQRGDEHQALNDWNLYKERTFEMILKKEASLFVIYNENRPIDICLNYHVGNVFVNKIRSFDIDYSKFRLGYIDIVKQIEWCIENNYMIFDLMRGDLRYKREFCNTIANFDYYVLYQKYSLGGKLMAFAKAKELMLRPKLRFIKIALRKVIKKQYSESESNVELNQQSELRILELRELPKDLSTELIDINNREYNFLRKVVYDFQYSTSEHSKNIQIYKLSNDTNSFIVKGKENITKIDF